MKKILLPLLVISLGLVIAALTKPEEKTVNVTLDPNETVITWTAYKTTDKIPVTGVFEKVSFEKSTPGTDLRSALENTVFEIPVKSIFSDNLYRDGQLRRKFFQTMIDTEFIKGSIDLNSSNSGEVKLTMNGITFGLPITYSIEGNIAKINAVMDLQNWKAQAAIDALNEVCGDLHMGPDGVSMTWNDVAIEVQTQMK